MGSFLGEHRRNSRTRCGWLWVTAWVTACAAPAPAAINVNVTQVGFPAMGSTHYEAGNVIRRSAWVPIVVDLDLLDQPTFDGSLRVAQVDTDGDRFLDSVEVHLSDKTGGHERVWLYTMINPARDDGRCYVELLNQEGEAVEVITAGEPAYRAGPVDDKQPNHISDDDYFILSISASTIGHIKSLADSDDVGLFMHNLVLGHVAPADMPELWYGLEAADAIVWDNARPEELTARQLQALIQWVREGGVLLLTASESAGAVRLAEPLARILPVDLGDVQPLTNLPDVRRELLAPPTKDDTGKERVPAERFDKEHWAEEPLPAPIPVVTCTLRPDAKRVSPEDPDRPLIVARRSEGRGTVIFSGVTLRDLLTGGGGAEDFFTKLLWLNKRRKTDDVATSTSSLFPHVVSSVAFTTSSSVYLLAASVFSILYVVIATGGVWWFLGRRGWRKHSWSVFGLAAIGAAFLSVTGVRAFQGFGDRVHEVSIVDLTAGDTSAFVTSYFGLKTATDSRLDVWLPLNPARDTEPAESTAFLRPLPVSRLLFDELNEQFFSDPVTYRIKPSVAALDNVRFRATLKRFEGRWDGTVDGTVDGDLTVRGRVFTDESYLVNDLGLDLTNCWLIQTVRPFSDFEEGVRDSWIYAFPIGTLPGDATRVNVAERCYTPDPNEPLAQFLGRRELGAAQKTWSRAFRSTLANIGLGASVEGASSLEDVQKAMLLATTVGELDPGALKGLTAQLGGVTQTWSRDRLRWLDLRRDFSPDTAVLIGFAKDPGPVRLFRRHGTQRYHPVEPESEYSWTMYRVRLPVKSAAGPGDQHT